MSDINGKTLRIGDRVRSIVNPDKTGTVYDLLDGESLLLVTWDRGLRGAGNDYAHCTKIARF